jgi:hypothetical protein
LCNPSLVAFLEAIPLGTKLTVIEDAIDFHLSSQPVSTGKATTWILKPGLNFGLLSALQTHIIQSPKKSREEFLRRRVFSQQKIEGKDM